LTPPAPTSDADAGLLALMELLRARGYAFVTPTPSTHALVRDRREAGAADLLRDIFGWTRPFKADLVDAGLWETMQAAQVVISDGSHCRAALRASTVAGRLYLHSAPTQDNDAVFLGPDSYRYARLIDDVLGDSRIEQALDIGTGAGVGALTILADRPDARVWGSDINPEALRLAGINALHNGLSLRTTLASGVPAGPQRFDLIVANPPYIAGDAGRTYRDGGEDLGTALALSWVRQGLDRLTSGGRFVLYTGAPVVAGRDVVFDALSDLVRGKEMTLSYEEIDPDVFGRTLRQRAYRDVERIAAVGAVITAP